MTGFGEMASDLVGAPGLQRDTGKRPVFTDRKPLIACQRRLTVGTDATAEIASLFRSDGAVKAAAFRQNALAKSKVGFLHATA